MDFLLAGTLFSFYLWSFNRGRLSSAAAHPGVRRWKTFRSKAERQCGSRQRPFRLPPESVFSFRPECCSASQWNGVQLQSEIAVTFDRIPHG